MNKATERVLRTALEHLTSHRTCFVIAHRLSTILKADQILVMERGRIIERRTPCFVAGARGKYARLWEQSFLEKPAEESEENAERPTPNVERAIPEETVDVPV